MTRVRSIAQQLHLYRACKIYTKTVLLDILLLYIDADSGSIDEDQTLREQRMTNSGDGHLQPCSALKISETILKTGQIEVMKAWYTTVLGVAPFFEHAPPLGTVPLDLGGQTRASDLRMCFFRLSLDYPYVQSIGLFEEPGTGLAPGKGVAGLHHIQLMAHDLDALCNKYISLAADGLRPHRSTDHGPFTSFYYRDPDGNNVEITAQNFSSMAEMIAFMASDAFKANPSGHEMTPEAIVASRARSSSHRVD